MHKNKDKIRKKLKNRRDRLSKAFINSAGIDILKSFKKEFSPFLKKKRDVMVYLSTQSEVKTKGIISYLLRNNHRLYVPCVAGGKITAVRLSKKSKLQKGPYKIPEPINKQPISSPKKLSLIIVPGIGFDLSGNRIGFGCGYYDKFLKKTGPGAIKAALSFSGQVEKSMPSSKNDIKMDFIITEKTVLRLNKTTGGFHGKTRKKKKNT